MRKGSGHCLSVLKVANIAKQLVMCCLSVVCSVAVCTAFTVVLSLWFTKRFLVQW